MARFDDAEGLPIGEVLKRARARRKLDISAVEESTKIRIKYLRAMEADDWDVLPNHAYAKGFLRTYCQLLGLDADAIVDEYRRLVEGAGPPDSPFGLREGVLEGRHGAAPREPGGPSPLVFVGVGAVVVLAVLLVLGLFGGDDGGERSAERADQREQRREERRERRREREQREQEQEPEPTRVAVRLEVSSPVQVCLVNGAGDALVDDQVLAAGAVEGPHEAQRFELRFPSGYDVGMFDLFVAGDAQRVPEIQGPAAYEITPPDRVRQVEFPGPGCP